MHLWSVGGSGANGYPILVAAGALAFFFVAVMSAALSAYLDTILFRYATGKPIPGINPADLPPLPLAT